MRASIALLGGTSILFVGIFAISNAAQSSESTALSASNESANAYNATTGITEGITQAAGPGIVWMGVAAFIVIALGYLVVSSGRGR